MNRLVYIGLIFILSCSLNSDSAFWSQTKKVETDKIITKILFKDIKPNEKEFNPKPKAQKFNGRRTITQNQTKKIIQFYF